MSAAGSRTVIWSIWSGAVLWGLEDLELYSVFRWALVFDGRTEWTLSEGRPEARGLGALPCPASTLPVDIGGWWKVGRNGMVGLECILIGGRVWIRAHLP